MKTFTLQTCIFVLFGFFKSFKPSEPFLTPYLIENKGLSSSQVKDEVYPVWSYSYFVSIAPVALLAEVSSYKVVIIIEAIAHLATRIILIWGEGLAWMQAMQVTFAIAIAGELVYYSYIFKIFSINEQQRAQSLSRSAILLGHCLGSMLGQVLLLTKVADYRALFYISGVSISIATLLSLFFLVDRIVYEAEEEVELITLEKREIVGLFGRIMSLFKYNTLRTIIAPLLIYALNTTTLYNVESFASILWLDLLKKVDGDVLLNGYSDAAARFCASVGSIVAWLVLEKFNTDKTLKRARILISFACFMVISAMIFTFTTVENIYLSYMIYAIIVGVSSTLSAISSTWLGQSLTKTNLNKQDFALTFGIATLICSGTQSLMLSIISKYNISIRSEFTVFGTFAAALALLPILEVFPSQH